MQDKVRKSQSNMPVPWHGAINENSNFLNVNSWFRSFPTMQVSEEEARGFELKRNKIAKIHSFYSIHFIYYSTENVIIFRSNIFLYSIQFCLLTINN